ncbi:MAG: ubiquitin-conjugating enzyme E2 [Pirellulaceae bacterium]|nr:ubiquitin-conjugating enzyme E2 [Pirellulaceae bacterium]MDP6717765.1 ubiquitin-conjugating enzyme E2 [Pirellulaceae bacterium]
MTQQERHERLAAELEAMRALKKATSILDFEFTGDPPDRYSITLRGKGISRDTSPRADVEFVKFHKIDVRLPFSFPRRPPDIRWITPIFHPNISFSGFINLKDVGLPWDQDLGLDVVCERLWDVARLQYMDLSKATNYAAKNWFDDESTLQLPVDDRALRDRTAPQGGNVIRYQRRGDERLSLPASRDAGDVLFIGEDTPTPPLPIRSPPIRHRTEGDDDLFYIGDD